MNRLAALIAALCMLAPAVALAGTERIGRDKEMRGSTITTFEITPEWAIDDFTTPVPVCPSTLIIYEKSAAGVVSAYGTKTTDDTTAEIEAASLIQQFTTSTTTTGPVSVSKGSMEIRFVVDTKETSTTIPTKIRVICSGLASGGGGGVIETLAANLPATGNSSKIYRITNATNGADCDNVGGGTEQADCRWNGSAYESIASGVAGINNVVEDATPQLGGTLDGDENEIENVSKFNKVLFPSMATLQTAIDSCQNGSNDSDPACKIWLPPGRQAVTSTIRLGDVTLAGMQNGFEIAGHGAGIINSLGNSLSGTTLYWAGADGGTVMEVTGFGHWIHDIHIEGRSCTDLYSTGGPPQTSGSPDGNCDSDGSTTQVQAAYGIKQTGDNSASTPAGKNVYERLMITGVLDASAGYGVAIGDGTRGHDDQNDQTIFEQVRFSENRHCILHTDSQAVANEFRMMDCRGSTASPAIDLQYGGVSFNGGFMGNDIADATGFAIDYCATEFEIDGIAFENFGGGVYRGIRSVNGFGGACGYGNNYQSRITNNRMQMLADSSSTHYCIDWDAHGSLLVAGNTWMSNSSASARKCAIKLPLPGTRDRFITMLGNKSAWNNGADATDVAITVTAAGGAVNKVLRGDRGRWEILDKDNSFSISKDSTGMFVDADGDGAYDTGENRLNSSIFTSGSTISSNGSITIDIDDDQGTSPTTATLTVRNGSNAAVLVVRETGIVEVDQLQANRADILGPVSAGDQSTAVGQISFWGGSSFDQEYILKAPASGTARTFTLPADADATGECIKSINGTGTLEFASCGGAGGTPDGSNTQVQFNDGGAFGGDAGLTYDKMTDTLTAGAFDSPANATAGGELVIKEGLDDGSNTLKIKVPDSGLSGDVVHTVNAAGKLPPSAIAQTISECFPIYAPSATIADTDDITSLWRAPAAVTVSEVWCETDIGTVTADLQIDDGSPADIMGTDLVCDTSGETDSSGLTGSMADGDRLDLAITSVASSPKRLTFCVEYTYN